MLDAIARDPNASQMAQWMKVSPDLIAMHIWQTVERLVARTLTHHSPCTCVQNSARTQTRFNWMKCDCVHFSINVCNILSSIWATLYVGALVLTTVVQSARCAHTRSISIVTVDRLYSTVVRDHHANTGKKTGIAICHALTICSCWMCFIGFYWKQQIFGQEYSIIELPFIVWCLVGSRQIAPIHRRCYPQFEITQSYVAGKSCGVCCVQIVGILK